MIFCVCIGIVPQNAAAASGLYFQAKTAGSGNAISVKKITYEGEISNRFINGAKGVLSELEVDFATDVIWNNSAKVSSVKDNKGKKYRGYLRVALIADNAKIPFYKKNDFVVCETATPMYFIAKTAKQ